MSISASHRSLCHRVAAAARQAGALRLPWCATAPPPPGWSSPTGGFGNPTDQLSAPMIRLGGAGGVRWDALRWPRRGLSRLPARARGVAGRPACPRARSRPRVRPRTSPPSMPKAGSSTRQPPRAVVVDRDRQFSVETASTSRNRPFASSTHTNEHRQPAPQLERNMPHLAKYLHSKLCISGAMFAGG